MPPAGSIVRATLATAFLSFSFLVSACGRTKGAANGNLADAGGNDTGSPTGAGGSGGPGTGDDGGPDLGQPTPDGGLGGGPGGAGGKDAGNPDVDWGDGGPLCSSGNWCWVNPLPQGNALNAVWANADDDIWAGGDHGTLIHWNGRFWSNKFELDTPVVVDGLWGSARNDVWLVGTRAGANPLAASTSVIMHWDGGGWTATDHPAASGYTDVFGTSSNNVWAMGGGVPIWWNGSTWARVDCSSCNTQGGWSNAPNDTWAVGPDNLITHWDGSTWSVPPGNWDGVWVAAWGSGPNDVWIVGGGGVMAHWNGGQILQTGSIVPEDLLSVWGSGPTDVWAVGTLGDRLHYDGVRWTMVQDVEGPDLYKVRGLSATQQWAVGRAGHIIRWEGTQWGEMSSGAVGLYETVGGTSATDVWFGGSDGVGIQHMDQSAQLQLMTGGPTNVSGIFSLSPTQVWVVGDTAAEWNGQSWIELPGSGPLSCVWASSDTDVWAGGVNDLSEGLIRHWDGQAWSDSQHLNEGAITRIAGNGPSDIWAVTNNGQAYHYDGTMWTQVPTGNFNALWGVMTYDSGQAWVVGEGGSVIHIVGDTPSMEATPFMYRLESIFRAGPNDHWTVGYGGLIGHFDGTSWTASESGTNVWLMDVWGSGANDLWAVGFDGAVLHKQQ
jgi:hypothetical protein